MIRQLQTLAKTYRPFTGDTGVYVSVVPTDGSLIHLSTWAAKLGFPMNNKEAEELHCTVIYSKIPIDPVLATCNPKKVHTARFSHFEYWDGHDKEGYLVCVLQSKDLQELHRKWLSLGAIHSFEDYTPHVTLKTGLSPTPSLYKKMLEYGQTLRGTVLEMYNEQVESLKG